RHAAAADQVAAGAAPRSRGGGRLCFGQFFQAVQGKPGKQGKARQSRQWPVHRNPSPGSEQLAKLAAVPRSRAANIHLSCFIGWVGYPAYRQLLSSAPIWTATAPIHF